VQQDLLAIAVDEQVGDREFTEIPPGEGFVFLSSRSVTWPTRH